MEFAKLHKPKNMPNTVVIILAIIICAVFLTWIVPAEAYTRITNAEGIKVIDPSKFSFTAAHPVSLAAIPMHIVKGFKSSVAIFLVILFSGGAFQYINSSGALQSVVAKMVRRYASKIWIFIPVLSLIFTLIATSQAVNTFIPFAPIFVMIAKAMKLDSIVGVGIILLGGAVGFSTGTLNTSTTMVAQEIAGLPLFSGIGYRAFCLVVFSIVTNIYLIKYATRISKNPERSYMYDLDQASGEKYDLDTLESFGPMTTKKWLVLGVLVATSGHYGGDIFPYLLMLNPTDVFRIINLFSTESLRNAYGLVSVVPPLLSNVGVLAGVMLAWIVVPLMIANWRFKP